MVVLIIFGLKKGEKMEVKNIVKKVLIMIQNDSLADKISQESYTLTTYEQKEIDLIINSINLTQQNIATKYYSLIDVVKVANTTGEIKYSDITSKHIYNILSVKNAKNVNLKYVLKPTSIVTNVGDIVIKYSYFPQDVAINDNLSVLSVKINERAILYGAISEYLFVKGIFDEAEMWEKKFKDEVNQIINIRKNAFIPPRTWR